MRRVPQKSSVDDLAVTYIIFTPRSTPKRILLVKQTLPMRETVCMRCTQVSALRTNLQFYQHRRHRRRACIDEKTLNVSTCL